MPCHHCGKARQASKLAIKAALKGDISRAVDQTKQAGAHIKAKLTEVDLSARGED